MRNQTEATNAHPSRTGFSLSLACVTRWPRSLAKKFHPTAVVCAQDRNQHDLLKSTRAMVTRVSALLPSGEAIDLEVTPEMTGWELKEHIKTRQPWDEPTSSTTGVEIIIDGMLLAGDENCVDAGIAEDAVLSIVFKTNFVICSNQDVVASLGGVIDYYDPKEPLLAVEIPSDETRILEGAFAGCYTLAKLTIPDSVTHIGDRAFQDCDSLVSLTIPNSVTHIGESAFSGCSSLKNLTISDSVTHIEKSAFAGCSALANLHIPNSVIHIKSDAFAGCSSLENLNISDSVTLMGDGAFEYPVFFSR